jgi:hypothetical protein
VNALEAFHEAGRNDLPQLLWDSWTTGRISAGELRELLPGCWSGPEWPVGHLGDDTWLYLFREAGWVSTYGSPRPDSPVTLYRGAPSRHARGMSWTEDPDRAEWFARRWGSLRDVVAPVWMASVDPGALLGRIDDRNEAEYVVDPARLPRLRRVAV